MTAPREEATRLPAGVTVRELRVISDARGAVLHMFRTDQPDAAPVAEVYFSEVNAGTTKGWKRHTRMTQRLAVPVGRMRFTLFDDRTDSPTRGAVASVVLGRPDRYALLTIPPGIWYAFAAVGASAIVANCADLTHDPTESEQRAIGAPEMPDAG